MDAIAKTAYYCCGVRAADAASAKPICGDHLAQRFMSAEARDVFKAFAGLSAPNRSNATRHRIIDDWVKARLETNPHLRIVLIGAGFDTRAFRLQGGRWLELDQPPLIALKTATLPASEAANPLERIAIDFASEKLSDKLAPYAEGGETVVILEGVSMYLDQQALAATLGATRQAFPNHTLMCDLMTRRFSESYGKAIRKIIANLGGGFATLVDDPATAVAAIGYRQVERVSMVERAVELGALGIPRWILNTFLKSLRDGYCAYRFEALPG
jgi:methyltransferase (TIGR00027 family)